MEGITGHDPFHWAHRVISVYAVSRHLLTGFHWHSEPFLSAVTPNILQTTANFLGEAAGE